MAKMNPLLQRIAHFMGWQKGPVSPRPSEDKTILQDQSATATPSSLEASYFGPIGENREFPYIVVRVFTALYQREDIRLLVGPQAVSICAGRCYLQHPEPLLSNGTISPDCRRLLVEGVEAAVRNLKNLRMCIVWAPQSCTYVDVDRTSESASPPSGGDQGVRLQFAPQHHKPVAT